MALQTYLYGIQVDDARPPTLLELELTAYRMGLTPEIGGLGRAGHFRKIVEIIWGPKSPKHFVWHPWAERMNTVCHEHPLTGEPYPHVAISGCASSGKTDFGAVYGLVNWMCDPMNTLVLATSTDLKGSRKRIWGSIVEYYKVIKNDAPAKLTDSMGIIRTDDGSGTFSDKRGLALIAGDNTKAQEAMRKLIGAKNKRVFLLADELCELAMSLLTTAFGNLSQNPFYQIVGFANFKSRLDPFGVLYEPKDGYDMVDTVNLDEWETTRGWALHFDGLKSPNILSGKDEWPIYNSKGLAKHKKDLGENTAEFWRQCRSAEPPIGMDNTIYSESDFHVGKAYDKPIWESGYVNVAASDPSYTSGGDRFILYFGKYGKTTDGKWTLAFTHFKPLREDVRLLKERLRSFQMADQIKAECEQAGVRPEHYAQDTTAAGSALADVVSEVWSSKIYRVNFSGAATERPANAEGIIAQKLYVNRVSELWYVGKEFLKYGQIKGLQASTAREMKARQYKSVKGADGFRMVVEPKVDMKLRLMFSPDEADAAFVLLDLCRERLRFMPAGLDNKPRGSTSFKELAKQMNRVYTAPAYA